MVLAFRLAFKNRLKLAKLNSDGLFLSFDVGISLYCTFKKMYL